jgi:CDP-glucose 4,6-dehydratase
MKIDKEFWKNRKVLITGHTGFKGSWLCLLLHRLGSDISGYALNPPTNPSLFEEAKINEIVHSYTNDIRDYSSLLKAIQLEKPEIVIHMAAQSLVLESFNDPMETYDINVMGTVKLLEAIRHCPGIKAVVNVTSDKCYENREWPWGYRENEPMGGYDPYSNSKGCSELVTSSFRNSFFNPSKIRAHGVALASARAGNVIGGGDWAENRLIPDFMRALYRREKIKIRNPHSVRPWQHVLEPITGYLLLAQKLYYDGANYADGWNFGPSDNDAKSVEWVVNYLCKCWGKEAGYEVDSTFQLHEAKYLKLDCSKAKMMLDWQSKWNLERSLESIVEWYKVYEKGGNIMNFCNMQIDEFLQEKAI